jgi:hypothetical protein
LVIRDWRKGKHVTKKKEPVTKEYTPHDVASAMRKDALKNVGKDPLFRIYRGWKFGLSYGSLPMPTREVWEKLSALPGGIASIITRIGFKEVPKDLSYDAFLSQLEAAKKVGLGLEVINKNEWIWSASLHPRGRSSVEEDWRLFGQMMAAVGAPRGSLVTPIETTDPNAVHYCIWREDSPSVETETVKMSAEKTEK